MDEKTEGLKGDVNNLKTVMVMPSGMVAVFDGKGRQVPECQGFLPAVLGRIAKHIRPDTECSFGATSVRTETLMAMARECSQLRWRLEDPSFEHNFDLHHARVSIFDGPEGSGGHAGLLILSREGFYALRALMPQVK
jgi:hypothetical protein